MQISIHSECKNCNGTGMVDAPISLSIVNDIVLRNEHNKINAIKEVRSKYYIHLKEAKQLVEASMLYIEQVEKISGLQLKNEEGINF